MRRRNATPLAARTFAQPATASISWGYFVLTVVCACVMAAGFFLAARQHFNAMDFGMKNSKLRKQVEELQAEKRRLTLAREIALSPAEIRKAARGLGLRERGTSDAVAMTASAPAGKTPAAPKPVEAAAGREKADDVKATRVVMTETEKPIADKAVKKIVMQKERRERDGERLIAQLR